MIKIYCIAQVRVYGAAFSQAFTGTEGKKERKNATSTAHVLYCACSKSKTRRREKNYPHNNHTPPDPDLKLFFFPTPHFVLTPRLPLALYLFFLWYERAFAHCIGAPGLNPPCPRFVNRMTIIPMNATSSKTVSAIVPALVDIMAVGCGSGWIGEVKGID